MRIYKRLPKLFLDLCVGQHLVVAVWSFFDPDRLFVSPTGRHTCVVWGSDAILLGRGQTMEDLKVGRAEAGCWRPFSPKVLTRVNEREPLAPPLQASCSSLWWLHTRTAGALQLYYSKLPNNNRAALVVEIACSASGLHYTLCLTLILKESEST